MTYKPEFLTLVALVAGAFPPAALAEDGNGSPSGPTVNSAGYKVIGWNDLGMHCMDGKDYSIFGVLPPYNTIHAHLIDPNGNLVTSGNGYTVSYQAVVDPLTNSINTTSALKTNFWEYATKLGFGSLAPDVGLKGFRMPGTGSVPMNFSTADNTFVAEGIPITPWADASKRGSYRTNYFPMMRLVAKSSSGAVLASTDIVLPVSDEMTCKVCHASNAATSAAMPSGGWVNDPDPAKDVKLNILRKHDDRFKNTDLYRTAATLTGYSAAGLEATVASTPLLCGKCHATNALGLSGVSGVEALTTAMHGLHANVTDPVSNLTLENWSTRDSCYRCHPGPNTQCLRGAMGSLKNGNGYVMECQSCHGSMSTLAVSTRKGWLEEPTCQSCHTGTATSNSGQIVYTSVFSSGPTVRKTANSTFATNANTPAAGLSLYRFSKGHGDLQCEACHGSTHAEYATPIVNDNVQSNALQGHVGMISECTSCHPSSPSTYDGGPHGLHPLGQTWVSSHPNAARSLGDAACQACHGQDLRGTILSKAQADRSFSTESGTKTFARGTIIGCYSCHNGPNPL